MTDRTKWYIVGIVGIVAFVAIILMVIEGSTSGDTSNYYTASTDETGLAAGGRVSTVNSRANTCTDSDNGYNYTFLGKVVLVKNRRAVTYTDTCFGGVLKEYACGKSAVTSKNYSCPYGCSNGSCLSAPLSECTDSDGRNTSTAGYVSGYLKNVPYTRYDYCTEGVLINEYYCYSTGTEVIPTTRQSTCIYGCAEGKCNDVRPTNMWCNDSDYDNQYKIGHVAGMTPNGSYYYTDSCDVNTLTEYYCQNGFFASKKYTCEPNNNEDGYCVDARCIPSYCNDAYVYMEPGTTYALHAKNGEISFRILNWSDADSKVYLQMTTNQTMSFWLVEGDIFTANGQDFYIKDLFISNIGINSAAVNLCFEPKPLVACPVPTCIGAYTTGAVDDNGCSIYACPPCPQYVPLESGWCNGTIIPGIVDNYGCIIQPPECVPNNVTPYPCAHPACTGAYDSGKVDQNGCTIFICPPCPVYDMIPGWCENGTIVPGLVDHSGCQSAPMCINDVPKCIDSDGGRDYYVKGAVNSTSVPMLQYDTCGAIDGQKLHELYCNGSNVQVQPFIDCQYGCSDGACLRAAPQCYDSDPQDNLYTKGYATINNGKTMIYDQCGYEQGYVSDTMLIQSYCDGYRLRVNESYNCQYGCSDGACVSMPPPPSPPSVPV